MSQRVPLPEAYPATVTPWGRYVLAYCGGPTYSGLVGPVMVEDGLGRVDGINVLAAGLFFSGKLYADVPGASYEWDGQTWTAYQAPEETPNPLPTPSCTHGSSPADPLVPGVSAGRRGPGRPRKVAV